MAGCGRIQNYHLEWPDGSVRDGQIRAWQISINLAVKVKKSGNLAQFLGTPTRNLWESHESIGTLAELV